MIVGNSKPKVIIHLVNIVSRFCYACGSLVCTLGLHTSVYWKTYSGPFWDRSTPAILVSKQSQSAARWACEPLHVSKQSQSAARWACEPLHVSKQSQSADRWASEPLHVNHLLPSSPDPLRQTLTIRSSTQPNVPHRTSPTPQDPQLSPMCRPGHLLHHQILNSAQCAAQDNKRYEF